jgi:hypothetical protein
MSRELQDLSAQIDEVFDLLEVEESEFWAALISQLP